MSEAKTDKQVILNLENISKSFGDSMALNNVSLKVHRGEILAVLGENGAGKSTLMKIITGLLQPDSGEISVNNEFFQSEGQNTLVPIVMKNPRFSMLLGVGMVYQHFQLVDKFTVSENITFGQEFSNFGILDTKKANEEVKKLGEKFGLPIDPNAIVEEISVGLKQRVEILKQLYRNANLLILDEPTAVLTPSEVKELFITIKELQKAGTSIIFISHKLHEPLEIADRIVAIRKGAIVGEVFPKNTNKTELAELIVGRKLVQQLDRKEIDKISPILEVKNLILRDEEDRVLLSNISFDAKSYRILGIAGVQGNGQSELVETIMGLRTSSEGIINLINEDHSVVDLTNKSTLDIFKNDVAYIPEDRSTQGLISDFLISENVWLGFYDLRPQAIEYINKENGDESGYKNNHNFIDKFMIPFSLVGQLTHKIISALDVRTGSETAKVKELSGGNQQKVLIGREFAKSPRLIIASEPTRGVDIGVMENVHHELITRRNLGVSIILISSDLDEILKLSDDIMIMYEGEIVSNKSINDYTMDEISQYMTSGNFTESKEVNK